MPATDDDVVPVTTDIHSLGAGQVAHCELQARDLWELLGEQGALEGLRDAPLLTIKSLVFEGQLLSQMAPPDELFCGGGSDQCEDGPEDGDDPGQVVQQSAPSSPLGVATR